MKRQLLFGATVGLLALSAFVSPSAAVTLQWGGGSSGLFSDPLNWWTSGGTHPSAPPGASDSAAFANGSTVYFTDDITNQSLYVNANGSVAFASQYWGPHTYNLSNNAYITAGGLTLGGPYQPLNLSVGNLLSVANSNFTVSDGSMAAAGSLRLGGGASPTTLLVTGGDPIYGPSTLTIAGNADVNGFDGGTTLAFQYGSQGTIGGSLNLAQSGGVGALSVTDYATLSVGNINAGTRDLQSGPTPGAQITVDRSGAVIQTGNSSLALGGNSNSVGTLVVANYGTFTTGSGATTLGARGAISVAPQGVFRALGDVSINTAGSAGPSPGPNGYHVSVSGSGATFRQEGPGAFTVGATNGAGLAVVYVGDSGLLSTGTGDLTVQATGVISVLNGGRFVANGNVRVNTAGGVMSGNPAGVGTIYVTGSGSSFIQYGDKTFGVGHPATGTGTVTVDAGASLTTGSG